MVYKTIISKNSQLTTKLLAYLAANPEKQHGEIRTILNNAYSFIQIRAVANHIVWLQHKNTLQPI